MHANCWGWQQVNNRSLTQLHGICISILELTYIPIGTLIQLHRGSIVAHPHQQSLHEEQSNRMNDIQTT
jgi:hypothetical protein